ncbi:DDE Tnp 1-associated protein [Porphyromonas gulae]|uniref:DDE Tnp 1-associated protein n=1 Tax=Porphyromonas gulae TaxID=111105 RepID=A0A0A2F0Z3_9PORP|nr:DDE Tnp 1-associated protein [Porphyromonas gulae]KGN85957.1 DDE Tnp 1-associated protein [Porphyromonas gulae]
MEGLFMVSDPRIESKEVYPLDFLLLIVFLSTLSGDTSWYEIEDYAEEYEEELKSRYETLTIVGVRCLPARCRRPA